MMFPKLFISLYGKREKNGENKVDKQAEDKKDSWDVTSYEELEDIRKKLLDGQPIRDEEIKRAIKLFGKSEMEEENV